MDNKRRTVKITYFFFIFSVGCVLTFILLDFLFFKYSTKEKLLNDGIKISTQKELNLVNALNNTKNILFSIQESKHFQNYLKNPYDEKNDVSDIFFMFTQYDKNIMQLEYIDKNGFEKIRINKDNPNSKAQIAQQNELLDKSNNYYFKNKKNLEKEFWYSNLGLSVEHKETKTLYIPSIKAVLPLYKKESFEGVLIINYNLKNIFESIFSNHMYDLILFNEKGFPLIHFEESKSWGLYQKKQITMEKELGKDYKSLIPSIKELYISDSFLVKEVDISLPQKLYIYLKLNDSYLNSLHKDRYKHYFSMSIIILILSVLMSLVFTRYLKKIFLVLKDTKSLNKLLNHKVDEKTKELRESKQQLTDIITTINDYIWEINLEGELIYLSPQVENILGYKVEDLLGKKIFEIMPKKEAAKIEHLYMDSFERQEPILNLKNKNLDVNGNIVYLETSANPILDLEGNFLGYRGSNRDITLKVNSQKIIKENYKKIKELNENLAKKITAEVAKNQQKDMQLFAQSKLVAMGEMIANIAHQWRQPLSAISTIASGIRVKQEYKTLNENELIDDMQSIVNKTQQLSKTIDTFMNFLKEGKQFQYVGVKKLIQTSLEMVDSALHNYFIKVETNFDSFEDFKINTIQFEVQEVLINILNNAKDAFVERNISNRKITINVEKNDEKVFIKIEDNAGGIPENIIDRIFEPYFTTKHESQGTGLGLHMSYRVITESLKGRISVENSSKGAVFKIELPLK